MADAPDTFVADTPSTFVPDAPEDYTPKIPPFRAALAAKQLGDVTEPFKPFVPLGPDIKAETTAGKLLAAPYNVGKGILEGTESPGGLALMPLAGAGKLAQGALGVGFGLPAVKEGLHRVYEGAAMEDPQEALEGALQTITGGLITTGGLHGALAKEAPKTFVPEPEKPPIIPAKPPIISQQEAPPTAITEGEPPIGATAGSAVAGGGEAPPAALPQASNVTDKVTEQVVTPSGPQMGAAGVEEIRPTGTALKNAVGEMERVGLGLRDAPEQATRNMAAAWEKSGVVEQANPGSGKALADSLIADPERGLTDDDSALLLRYKTDLRNRMNDAAEKTHIGDPKARETAQKEYDALREHFSDLLDAVNLRGSQWGLEGRWRQAMAQEDFTFHSVDEMNRFHRVVTGEEMPGKATEKATKKAKAVKDAQGQADVANNEVVTAINTKAKFPPRIPNAEQNALDAANRTVRENAIRLAEAENKARVSQTIRDKQAADIQVKAAEKALRESQRQVREAAIRAAKEETKVKEQTKLDDQERAASKALAAANKSVSDAAKRLADAENKIRVAKAAAERKAAIAERAKEQKTLFTAQRVAREAAIKLAKEQSKPKSQTVIKERELAARKALEAADKTVRENAKKIADAETAKRIAKTFSERKTAAVQEQAARKAAAAADKVHRESAIALSKAQRALQDDPIRAVWSKAKEIIDKGETDFNEIRAKVAKELGKTADQVRRIMAQDPRVKRLMDDAWLKQNRANALRQNAKAWVAHVDMPAYEKAIASIPRILFGLKVGFHGTVALGTHAPTVAFQPRFWASYVSDFGKMYRMVADPAFYERETQDLVRRKNYVIARRAGLVNDPTIVEDFSSPDTAKYFGRLTGMGNRGYTVLKILRQDMFDQMYSNLPRSLQVQDGVAAALADQINHATGVVKARAPRIANLAVFAPRLEASRFMQVLGDPVRAARTIADWGNASTGEKTFALNQVKEKAWIVGTLFSALALNQGFLSAMGSNQKINGIPQVLGGRGFDPLESDFLKFKIAGYDAAYGSAILNMVKLPPRLAIALIYHGKGSKLVLEDERMGKVVQDYIRSQLSPVAGTTADLLIGRDYAGRPLPRAGFGLLPGRTDIPKRLRTHGVTEPYSWKEYASQQFTPIPISEGIREVWKDGLGMSDQQIEAYLKAWAVVSLMGGTGSRITEDKNVQQEQ